MASGRVPSTLDVVVFVVVLVMVELSEAVKTFAVWAFEGKQCLSVEQRERYWSVWHWCTCLCHGCFREVTEFLHRSHGEVREGSRGTFSRLWSGRLPQAARRGNSERPAGVGGWRPVVAGVGSGLARLRLGFVGERQLEQHGALASLVDEVGLGLVVILSDLRYDRNGRAGDPAVAGQACGPDSILADCYERMIPRGCLGGGRGIVVAEWNRPFAVCYRRRSVDGAGWRPPGVLERGGLAGRQDGRLGPEKLCLAGVSGRNE